jgi:hypothetical protein
MMDSTSIRAVALAVLLCLLAALVVVAIITVRGNVAPLLILIGFSPVVSGALTEIARRLISRANGTYDREHSRN